MIAELIRELTKLQERVSELERRESVKTLYSVSNPIGDVQIASGVVDLVRGRSFCRIESETGVTDNLDTIDDLKDGQIIILTPLSGHTITVTESGNFNLGVATRVLDNEADILICIGNETITKWCEIAYANNV